MTRSNCTKCDQPDSEEMVQCDKCDRWYHFDCVGVDSGVADYSWSCELCSQHIPAHAHTFATTTMNNVAQALFHSDHVLQISQPSQNTTTISPTPASTMYSYNRDIPASNSTGNFPTVTNHAIFTTTTSMNLPFFNSSSHAFVTAGASTPTMTSSIPNARCYVSSRENFLEHQNNLASAAPNPTTSLGRSNEHPVMQMLQQRNLQLQRLEEEMKLQKQFLDTKYEILAQTQGGEPSNLSAQMNLFTNSITTAQLAARQVMPKKLPNFDGNPEDWPLFISSFENSTAAAGFTDAENLVRLQDCLKGKAREMVRSRLCLPNMVPEIISTLRMCFGRPEHILERIIYKTKNMPAIKDKLESLIDFSLSVRNICSTMESCQMNAHMHNPFLVKEWVEKLPNNQKLSWAMSPKDERVPIVKMFSDWLYKIAEAASTVVSLTPNKGSATLNTHMVAEIKEDADQHKSKKCYVCDNQHHKVNECNIFKSASLSRKWTYVNEKNLCRQCLGIHRRKCYKLTKCGVEGCTAKHHPLLHKVDNQTVSANVNTQRDAQVNAHTCQEGIPHPYFRIVPVNIRSKNKLIKTFAFLDEGSAVTLIEKGTFDELGVQGESSPLCLRWTGNTTRTESDSLLATIEISNVTNGHKFKLKEVRTVHSLDLPEQSINVDEVFKKYPHLKGLPLESYNKAKPKILIGVNNWRLAVPLNIKEGKANEPIASKCRLGWTLQGCDVKNVCEYQLNVHVCDCQRDHQLHEAVKEYFNLENSKSKQLLSIEDNRALQILNETCKKYENRYEIGLPWRTKNVKLPESYCHAFHRLMCLHKKFIKEPGLKTTVQEQIDNLITKGYARKLTPKEATTLNENVWYLPIFMVKNLNKPEKLRIVWDAAAKSNGASLNDFLLSGPDLLNSLVEVLLAFRVGKIAVCGDIAEMFHRINVRESDMHAQRFLWWDKNDDIDHPSSYVMRALTFGVRFAPCIAHFIRDKNAEQFKDVFPRAVEAVHKYHYVDDFIDSADNDLDAISLASQVKQIHASAGFDIRNWSSNSLAVLNHLEADTKSVQSSREWGSTTKVLGMFWDPANDQFRYIFRFARLRRDVINKPIVPTKREVLQVLMSIFDPLGFISCYTMGLKILLQDIWRSGLNWDELLSEELYKKWCKWKSIIPSVTNLRIPRCYSTILKSANEVQLHTFVDAGENAYSAVSYLRVINIDTVSVVLVAAKSKVSPLKPLSILRLELQAAVIGVRLAAQVLNVRRIQTTAQFYWTDSKTTLRWLRLDPKGFHQFVMHRVGEILESTDVNQWKWVPSALNPADLATKTTSRVKNNIWFSGPDFLLSKSSDWPTCEPLEKGDDNDSEVKHRVLVIQTSNIRPPDFNYFSCWKRLQRAVATFILFTKKSIAKSKNIVEPQGVTSEMYETARIFLLKYAQAEEYSAEIYNLKRGKPIANTSKLISLNVYLDENGILKSKGRVEHLNNHGDAILLPQDHRVTFLLVRWFHESLHHQMHETVINRIRCRFYIPRLRVLYRKVRRSCQICKNNSATPSVPQMAALPAARLAAFERPFTYTGIDYFGPFFVAVGRRREKRWGVIFTCLTVRAIHIELAHSLDASSCIMAITNFISRRGSPREIFSDNGTNFKAAEKILNDHIKWRFNPPSSPHMGGAWERLIKSVKNILYGICPTMQFNDENLRCALNEVEFIVNARPLTFVSIESTDDEAITPNHLLIGSSDGFKPIFNEDVDLRQRWHQTQKFADQFWRRWVKEYLPIITRRSKWFNRQPSIKIGDVVVITDPDLPRNNWPKGIIIDTVVAKDGQVRIVTVKTKSSIFQRPVAKIAVLDVGVSDGKLVGSDSFTGEGMLPLPKT